MPKNAASVDDLQMMAEKNPVGIINVGLSIRHILKYAETQLIITCVQKNKNIKLSTSFTGVDKHFENVDKIIICY